MRWYHVRIVLEFLSCEVADGHSRVHTTLLRPRLSHPSWTMGSCHRRVRTIPGGATLGRRVSGGR